MQRLHRLFAWTLLGLFGPIPNGLGVATGSAVTSFVGPVIGPSSVNGRRDHLKRNGRKVSVIESIPAGPCPSSHLLAGTRYYKTRRPSLADELDRTGEDRFPTKMSVRTDNNNDDDDDDDEWQEENEEKEEILSCRIVGFYPFPTPPPKGPLSWIFRDTHQAIIIRTSAGRDKLIMDFMTEGGQTHPVWWDEQVKWRVFFGGDIRGEVRVRSFPRTSSTTATAITTSTTNSQQGSKLQRIAETARAYDCNMNIYGNNCRIFCARMEREVKRLNAEDGVVPEDGSSIDDRSGVISGSIQDVAMAEPPVLPYDYMADGVLIWRIIGAALLPAIYPLVILWACWDTFF